MVSDNSVVVGIEIDASRVKSTLDGIRKNIADTFDVKNSGINQNFKDLENTIKKMQQQLRTPSKGGLSSDAFEQVWGFSKASAKKAIAELQNEIATARAEQQQTLANKLNINPKNAISLISQSGAVDDAKQLAIAQASATKTTVSLAKSINGIDHSNLVRLRYALYDVASAAQTTSQAMAAIAKVTVGNAVSYESAFTPVERAANLSGDAAANLRSQLEQLSTQLPNTFQDISGVAALGSALGIDSNNLTTFTEDVIKFSNASNMSTEQAAKAFGTLGELLNIGADQYNNLGSAIAYVGVNTNATESQITSVAEAIGGVAATSKLSASYTVGLAGAMASLKIPSEQARGSLTRIFAEVNRATAAGGKQLDGFAKVLGVTSEQAKSLAQTDMATFFDKFLSGLSGMNSQQITTTLDILNLADIRVTNTLQRLAGNIDTTTNSINMANQAYLQGSYLGEAYAKTQDDIAARWQTLVNTLNSIAANVGSAMFPALGSLIDILKNVASAFNDYIQTPAGKIVSFFGTLSVAAVAAGTAIIGALIPIAAGFLALKVAIREANNTNNPFIMGIANAANRLTFLGGSADKARVSLLGLNAETNALNKTNNGLVLTQGQLAAASALRNAQDRMTLASSGGMISKIGARTAMLRAETQAAWADFAAMSALQKVVSVTSWVGIITTAISVVSMAWSAFAETQRSDFEKNKKAAEDWFSSSTALADAMRQDAAAGAPTVNIPMSDGYQKYSKAATDAKKSVDALNGSVDTNISKTNDAGNAGVVAWGNKTKQALADLLGQNKQFQDLISGGAFNAIGGNASDFVAAWLGDPARGGQKYVDSLIGGIKAKLEAFSGQKLANLDLKSVLGLSVGDSTMTMDALAQSVGMTKEEFTALLSALPGVQDAVNAITGEIQGSANAATAAAAAQEGYNKALDDGQSSADAAQAALDAYKQSLSKISDFSGSLDALAQSIADNGTAFSGALDSSDNFTSGAIANTGVLVDALSKAITAAESMGMNGAAGVAQVFAQLVASGVEASNAIAAINSATGSAYASTFSMAQSGQYAGFTAAFNAIQGGAKKAGGAVSGTAAKVVTLIDYANQLKNVWSRAFDIRFSGQQALDKITSAFSSISTAIADARDEINGLNADIQKLSADRSLQEYFLSVAVAYGDTVKAQEIRANLAQIDSDLTSKTKALAKAQAKTNKTLSGTSDEAISNRAEILGLIGNYQDYMYSLASSGMSQDQLRAKAAQLKNDFISQATQLGYNQAELGQYASAFDDVSTAINNVPRNITVAANVNPAIQAMNELNAAANAASAGRTLSVGTSIDYAGLAKFSRGIALLAEIERMEAQYSQMSASQKANATGEAWLKSIQNKKDQLNSGNFAVGGYVSGPGTGTSDSIRANLSNGEYVVRAAAVSKYGVGFFDRLNQMQSPRFASGGYVAPASTGMVSLSPEDRALLRSIGGSGDITLAVDGVTLARAVNNGNQTIVAQGGRI